MTQPSLSEIDVNHIANPRSLSLWLGWLIVVGAWALQLFLSYGVVEWYCQDTSVVSQNLIKTTLHIVAWVCLAVVVLTAFTYWRKHQAIRQQRQDGESRSVLFIIRGGLCLSVFLAATILVQSLPNYFLNPCGGG